MSSFLQPTSDAPECMEKVIQHNGPSSKMERITVSKQKRCFVAHTATYTIWFSNYFTFENNKLEEKLKMRLLFQNVFFEKFQNQSFQAPFSSKLIAKFKPNRFWGVFWIPLPIFPYIFIILHLFCVTRDRWSMFFTNIYMPAPSIPDAFQKLTVRDNKIIW